jgi:hypothetical protein
MEHREENIEEWNIEEEYIEEGNIEEGNMERLEGEEMERKNGREEKKRREIATGHGRHTIWPCEQGQQNGPYGDGALWVPQCC